MVFRIAERFCQLLIDAKEVLSTSGAEADNQSQQTHELAPVILDYITHEGKGVSLTRGIVEVAELMLRLREGADVIKKTLHLVEGQGCAVRTDFKGVWEIIDSRSGP
jgi:hypothetical protein